MREAEVPAKGGLETTESKQVRFNRLYAAQDEYKEARSRLEFEFRDAHIGGLESDEVRNAAQAGAEAAAAIRATVKASEEDAATRRCFAKAAKAAEEEACKTEAATDIEYSSGDDSCDWDLYDERHFQEKMSRWLYNQDEAPWRNDCIAEPVRPDCCYEHERENEPKTEEQDHNI